MQDMLRFLFLLLPSFLLAELHTFTYASFENRELRALIRSGKRHDIAIDVGGVGKKYQGHGEKLLGLQNYLMDKPEEDLILFLDAFDTLIMDHKEVILERFSAMNASIVFNAEKNCFPALELAPLYPKCQSKHKYLNSGAFIGYVGAVRSMLEFLEAKPTDDDQLLCSLYFLSNRDQVSLDTNCTIFLPLEKVEDQDIDVLWKEKKLFYKPTQTIPAIIHGNGDGKKQYNQIANWML